MTDFGNHAVVQIDLPEGSRLTAQMPEAPTAVPGSNVTLAPCRHALCRDDRVLSTSDAVAQASVHA